VVLVPNIGGLGACDAVRRRSDRGREKRSVIERRINSVLGRQGQSVRAAAAKAGSLRDLIGMAEAMPSRVVAPPPVASRVAAEDSPAGAKARSFKNTFSARLKVVPSRLRALCVAQYTRRTTSVFTGHRHLSQLAIGNPGGHGFSHAVKSSLSPALAAEVNMSKPPPRSHFFWHKCLFRNRQHLGTSFSLPN
jgi:hypothetical protein